MAKTLQQLADKASSHQQRGEAEQAIAAYKALLVREPDLPDSWYNLGYVQRIARSFESALASYQQALDRGVHGSEEVHVNRAVILSEHLYRHQEAIDELRLALAINANYAPAMLNLGELLEDGGEKNEATTLYQKVLEIEPQNTLALARLASNSAIETKDDPIVARLRAAINRSSSSNMDKADIGFALGHLLDSVGAYDEAFSAITDANHASRYSFDVNGTQYDAGERKAYVDRMIESFPAAGDIDHPKVAEAPIFVCGMIRTGSTLTERILSSHNLVTAGGEMDLLSLLIASQLQSYPEDVAKKRPYDFKKIRKLYLKGLDKIHPNSGIITDKRPDNFLHVGLIKRIFPEAKIIHSKRNRLDKYLSIWFAHLDSNMSFALDFESISHWCDQFDRLEAHWKTLWPDDIHDFDYDNLVNHPEVEIRSLLSFCGLEWDESCLSPHLGSGIIRTGNVSQIREPLYQKSSGRWKHYETQLRAHGFVDEFGS